MTRVLQIRRGNTAQNDNFTGMAGEITFDTDAKTVRIHDGTTLGGFALARADEIPTIPEPFDITTVPDATWNEIFARIFPVPFKTHTGSAITLNSTDYIEYTFSDITTMPYIVRPILVARESASGYGANEETTAFGVGEYSHPMINAYLDSGGLHVRMAVGGGAFWVAHKSSGAKTDIVNSEWRLKFRIYC